MTKGITQLALSGDRPLADPAADRLGYAGFARQLADAIDSAPEDGLVIGLYGGLGTGKSTVLGFVEHYLDRQPIKEREIVVRFNPWWFSGIEDLAKRFFLHLPAALVKRKDLPRKVRKPLRKLASLVSIIPFYGAQAGKVLQVMSEQATFDLHEEKEKIEKILLGLDRKILIVIDDLDRLPANEIHQMLRTIKAIGNFPTVTYLLAFDKAVVVDALTKHQAIPGEAYLGKIVQIPFDMPPPDPAGLRSMFLEQAGAVFGDRPQEFPYDDLGHFVSTPRDVVRLANVLAVAYAATEGDVNATQFIATHALRLYCPAALTGPLEELPEADREAARRLLHHVDRNG